MEKIVSKFITNFEKIGQSKHFDNTTKSDAPEDVILRNITLEATLWNPGNKLLWVLDMTVLFQPVF